MTTVDSGWLVNAPILVMDDESFLDYCKQIGIAPRLDGAVIRNQIRDVTNPDFRHPDFMPYLKQDDLEKESVSVLRQSGNEQVTAEIPVLSYAEEVPALREEYAALDYYELVHFIPVSLWKEIKGQTGGGESDVYIRVIGKENAALEELNALQDQIEQLLSRKYTVECENRIQEYETNHSQIWGMMTFFGALCVLLALIGIGNIFSNTLGFVRQRKREFARYMSIGLTPEELRKMFCIEALAIAGRPILITLPPAVLAAGYMLKLSYVDAGEFLAEAPLMPIIAFMLAILGAVEIGRAHV